ncbi:MAG: OmpA family protein [Dehalococcoidia bacterium]|nr:OmpA family protein [Dehalococcoidia bacterium]
MSRRKAPEAQAPENHERWIVSYADMLTLLFALFVVLYATSDANPHKLEQVRESIDRAFSVGVLQGGQGSSAIFQGGGIVPGINAVKATNMSDISERLKAFAEARGLIGKIQIREDADSITISLADNLLFSSGSAELKPGSQDVLLEVASILAQLPNDLRIEGHTDNIPVNSVDYATNWELSAARSATVLRFLIESGGLQAGRMQLAGYAETHPIADNTTAEGRSLNRRADIVIVYPTQEELDRALEAAGRQP